MDNKLIELAKKKAGYAAVNDYITDGMVVGIGSGSTVIYAVERLIQRVQQEKLHITCIPTSFQATQLIVDGGLTLGDLSRFPVIDVDIDGADEVYCNLNLIKGGGGCHVQEKILAQNSKQMIVVADYRKDSQQLGEQWKKGIPVEIIPIACVPLLQKFRTLGGVPTLRMAKNKAGPVISDNGHFIIDVDFGVLSDPASLAAELKQLTGVVDTGLFINLAQKAYFGQADGSVSTRELPGG